MTKFQEEITAAIGVVVVVGAAFTFIGLALAGVIPGATATNGPTPTATTVSTLTPTPAPELLGGEDRRACGYLFTSFEWAITQRDNPWEDLFWFTNNMVIAEDVMTLRDGCYLNEEGASFFVSDRHKPFNIMQFRLKEFGDGKNDFKLYHRGVLLTTSTGFDPKGVDE